MKGWRLAVKKILITRIGCELDVEFAAGALCVHRMLKALDLKSCRLEVALDVGKIRGDHDKIDIYRVNGFDVTIDRQPADQAPRLVSIQEGRDV